MKNFYSKFLKVLFMLFWGFQTYTYAQSPTDELMMPAQEICFLVNYEYGEFDQYWEGNLLRTNGTIASVRRRTGMVMAAYGITSKLNIYLGLPHVSTNSTLPNGGKFDGTSGLQDLAVGLKYEFLKKSIGPGELTIQGSLNFSTPASNYLSDYQPYALGLGTPQLAWRAVVHYRLENGLYIRGVGGYLWKGYTKTEREYYYNEGSYFTPWMDVPNSLNFHAALGKWFFQNSLRIELTYNSQRSTSGDDIRAYNAPQPTNKVNMSQVGGFAHYYFKNVKGLGVLGYFGQVIDGKNAPKMFSFGGGVTYQFQLFNKNKS